MKIFERHFLLVCFLIAVSFFWGCALFAIYSLQEIDRYLSFESLIMLGSSIGVVGLVYFIFYVGLPSLQGQHANSNNSIIYRLSRLLLLAVSVPAFYFALSRFFSQSGSDYLDMDAANPFEQLFSYAALYLYFICLSLATKKSVSNKEFYILFILVMLPRLLVGSISGRFVAIMPAIAFLFVGMARNYIVIKLKILAIIIVLTGYIIFVHPLVRAGAEMEVESDVVLEIMLKSGPVNLMEQLDEVSKEFSHVNFLRTGLIGNILPSVLPANEKEDLWKREGLAVTADRAFAIHEGANFEEMFGPGSIYVGELFLIGGWSAVLMGSAMLGMTMAFTQKLAVAPNLLLVPLLDFAVKVPFVPRSNITYMYERFIPLILFVLIFLIASRVLTLMVKHSKAEAFQD